MTSILHKLKSPEGRLSQQGYILGFVVPFVGVTAASSASFTGMIGPASSIALQACALGWTFLLGFSDAMNIRRYHDLGNSGRLYRLCRPGIVVLPLLAFVLQFLIPAQMATMGDLGALSFLMSQEFSPSLSPIPAALLGLTFAGVTINLVYLSLMPGQVGPNEHGPDPTGGVASVPGVARTDRAEPSAENDPVKRALAEYNKRAAPPPPQAARNVATAARAAGPASFGKKRG